MRARLRLLPDVALENPLRFTSAVNGGERAPGRVESPDLGLRTATSTTIPRPGKRRARPVRRRNRRRRGPRAGPRQRSV